MLLREKHILSREKRQIDISNAESQINNGLIKRLMKGEGHN
jgi:hypothetical protein